MAAIERLVDLEAKLERAAAALREAKQDEWRAAFRESVFFEQVADNVLGLDGY